MRFIQNWKAILCSTTIIAFIFIIWDAIFVKMGIWGFNQDYHLPLHILGLPLEEWLFFFCIPYASLFIYFSLEYYFPKLILSKKTVDIVHFLLVAVGLFLLLKGWDKWYTRIDMIFFIISLMITKRYLNRFLLAFLVILIPFFVVNGILTGTGLPEPVVWYHSKEFLGMRIGTIPFEDVFYAFSMLYSNLVLFHYFKKRFI
jgi:lycopene cyclase domain-containing protein